MTRSMNSPLTRTALALAGVLVLFAGGTGGQEVGPLDVFFSPLFKRLGEAAEESRWDWSTQGAWLKSDAESNTLFDRGKQLIEEGRYPQAALVLQRVLDSAGASLTTRNGHVYHSLSTEVEKLLAGLPPEGLAAYRLRADAEAAALLGAAGVGPDPAALKEVADRFFLSEPGDDAALRLAGLRLDAYRFPQAARLLRKIVDVYPDPSVHPAAVHARLAVASARLGDARTAKASLRLLDALNAKDDLGPLPDGALGLIRADVAAAPEAHRRATGTWQTAGPVRRGGLARPPLPDPLAKRGASIWITEWQGAFKLAPPSFEHNPQVRGRSRSRSELIKGWTTHGWTPAAQVAFADGRVLFRAHASLLCCDAETGTLLWERADTGRPKGADANYIHAARGPDGAAETRYTMHSDRMPRTAEEKAYFADYVGRMVSVIDGRAFCIQHNLDAAWNPNFRRGAEAEQLGTTLAAFDAETGDALWARGRGGTVGQEETFRFLSTPLAHAGRLLVPVEDIKGELLLLTLDPKDGSQIDRTFLCGYGFAIHQPPAAPVGMALDGGELFIASGAGLLFALDAASGRVLWASRYRQQLRGAPHRVNRMHSYPRFWDENVVVPFGGHLYVLPADSDIIARFDRQTGMPAGTWSRSEATSYVGVQGNGLIVSSATGIVRYNLSSATRAWEAQPGQITGRPMLSGGRLCVPTRTSVVLLDPETGKPVGEYGVENGGDPVGNLFTDGRRLVVAAMERVYALEDLAALLARLDQRIGRAPTAQALIERARVYGIMERLGEALADLRRARTLAPEEARVPLFKALMAHAKANPETADALLAEAEPLAVTDVEKITFRLAKAQRYADAGQLPEALALYTEAAQSETDALIERGTDKHALAVRASEHAAAVLRTLRAEKPETVPGLLAERGRSALGTAVPPPDPAVPGTMVRDVSREKARELLGIWRAFPGTDAAASALRMAADTYRERGDIERAEAVLAGAARDPNPRIAAAGLAAQARLNARQGWARTARRMWRRLAETVGERPVPWDGGDIPAAELAQKHLAELPGPDNRPAVPTLPRPPYKLLWSRPNEGVIAFGLDTDDEFLRDHIVLMSGGKPVCLRVADGHMVWRLNDVPQQWRRIPRFSFRQLGIMRVPQAWHEARGHLQATAAGGMQVLGLVSGRVLWSEEAERMGRADWERQNRARNGNIHPIYVEGDVTAVCRDENRIVVHETATSNVLWQRTFAGEEVLGTYVAPACVAVVLGGTGEGTSVWCCDRRTGRVLGTFGLYRNVRAMRRFPVVWTETRAVFLDDNTLRCRALPSGDALWEAKVEGTPSMMGTLTPDTAAVATQSFRKWSTTAYDIQTGEQRWTIDVPAPNQDQLQGMIADADGTRFYGLLNRRVNNWWVPVLEVRGMDDGKRRKAFAFARNIDDDARKLLQKQVDRIHMGNFVLTAQDTLPAGEFMLAFRMQDKMREVPKGDNSTATVKRRLWEPTLLGKRGGVLLRSFRMPVPEPAGMVQYPQFAGVKGSVLIVLSNRNIMAFVHDAAAAGGEGAP